MKEVEPTNLGDNTTLAMLLGEIRGQQREMVHSLNNLSGKFDGLAREVGGLGALAMIVGKLESDVQILKDARSKADGASSAWATILKSPAIGWLFTGAVALWAFLTGKVHL